MGSLFKKLTEQINISKIKKSPMTIEEKTAVEKDVIFGTFMEDLDDVIVAANIDAEQPDPDELTSVDAIPKEAAADLTVPEV